MKSMLRVLSCMVGQPKYVAPHIDMTGQTVLVTGPTRGGIGYETALGLARRGAHLLLVGRNKTRGEEAKQSILAELSEAQQRGEGKGKGKGDSQTSANSVPRVEFSVCDVSDMESVRTFVSALPPHTAIDVAVLNAGAQFPDRRVTTDGVELTFATCALGHHLLVHLLRPRRAVWITGDIYAMSKGAPSPTTSAKGYDAYARACLARLMLARKWKENTNSEVVCVHPGVVNSDFAKLSGVAKAIISKLFISPTQGAQAGIMAASSPIADLHQQLPLPYYHNKHGWFELQPNDPAMNEQLAADLFDECNRICNITVKP